MNCPEEGGTLRNVNSPFIQTGSPLLKSIDSDRRHSGRMAPVVSKTGSRVLTERETWVQKVE